MCSLPTSIYKLRLQQKKRSRVKNSEVTKLVPKKTTDRPAISINLVYTTLPFGSQAKMGTIATLNNRFSSATAPSSLQV